MAYNKDLTDVINDLIRINHDRTAGYQKAVEDLRPQDIDLKTMFTNMATTSVQFAEELKALVRRAGDDPADDSTQSGKIYRMWMDIKTNITDNDRKSVLDLCEFGEDAALKAYNAALKSDADMDVEVRQVIVNQRSNIQHAHDIVKRYRDMHESVAH